MVGIYLVDFLHKSSDWHHGRFTTINREKTFMYWTKLHTDKLTLYRRHCNHQFEQQSECTSKFIIITILNLLLKIMWADIPPGSRLLPQIPKQDQWQFYRRDVSGTLVVWLRVPEAVLVHASLIVFLR